MSNYTKENLIQIPPTAVPAGTLAIKVGNEIFTPGNIRISSGMDFYKCASVDTTSKTWNGYLAILGGDGVYTFEETVTTGLSYGTGYTPVTDRIYNADATISAYLWVGMPSDGLVFFASLSADKSTCESGQTLIKTGTVAFTTEQGIPCAYFDGSSDIHMASYSSEIPDMRSARTTSVWMKAKEYGWAWAVGYGQQGPVGVSSEKCGEIFGITSSGYAVYSQRPDISYSSTDIKDAWVHIVGTCDGTDKWLYVNGKQVASGTVEAPLDNEYGVYIGSSCGVEYLTGYVSAVRIYNRVLTQEEITVLANEFTPTA